MVNTSDFSKRLQQILTFYGLSATSFSEEIEFNRSTISHLLSGRNKPSLEFVMKVLKTYPEVELYWLLNGRGSFPAIKNSDPKNTTDVSVTNSEIISEISEAHKKHQKQGISENSVFEEISETKQNTPSIERIVVFYSNGTFKEYTNP